MALSFWRRGLSKFQTSGFDIGLRLISTSIQSGQTTTQSGQTTTQSIISSCLKDSTFQVSILRRLIEAIGVRWTDPRLQPLVEALQNQQTVRIIQ